MQGPMERDLAQLLARPEPLAILRALHDKGWLGLEQLEGSLPLLRKEIEGTLGDLERVGLVQRRPRPGHAGQSEFRFSPVEGFDSSLLAVSRGVGEGDVQQVARFYFQLFLTLLQRLKAVGGASTVADVLREDATAMENRPPAPSIIEAVRAARDVDGALAEFARRTGGAAPAPGDFDRLKRSFLEILQATIQSNERRLGKLYSRSIVQLSTKRLLTENAALVSRYRLLAGLPEGYFGGTESP